MGGIFGILAQEPDPEGLSLMEQRLSHLAPDGCDRRADGDVQLGQCQHWDTPESVGHGIASLPEAQCLLAADARIDDRAGLCAILGLSDAGELSDADLILRAYARFGDDMLAKLVGDFAIALWDGRRERLLLACDAFGVRPLAYHARDGYCAFASEPKGVLAARPVSRRVDRVRVADQLALGPFDPAHSFYEDVQLLAPGQYVIVERERVTRGRHHRLDPEARVELPDNASYTERFRELLLEATRSRLRGVGEADLLLSGGLDSTSLLGAARLLGQPFARTYSFRFPRYPEIDEARYIAEALRGGHQAAYDVEVDRLDPLAIIPEYVRRCDGPAIAPNSFVEVAALHDAKAQGTKLLLDGMDGDNTVGHGFHYLSELLWRGQLRRLASEVRHRYRRTRTPPLSYLWHGALHPILDRWAQRLNLRKPPMLHPALARELRYVQRKRALAWQTPALRTYQEQHVATVEAAFTPLTLRLSAALSGAVGITRRHPYFDRRLVEYCAAIPAEQHLRRGVNRIVQRLAAEGLSPDLVRHRMDKSVWAQNTIDRFYESLPVAQLRHQLRPDGPAAEYVDLRTVNAMLARVQQGQRDGDMIMPLWSVITTATWLESIDN